MQYENNKKTQEIFTTKYIHISPWLGFAIASKK